MMKIEDMTVQVVVKVMMHHLELVGADMIKHHVLMTIVVHMRMNHMGDEGHRHVNTKTTAMLLHHLPVILMIDVELMIDHLHAMKIVIHPPVLIILHHAMTILPVMLHHHEKITINVKMIPIHRVMVDHHRVERMTIILLHETIILHRVKMIVIHLLEMLHLLMQAMILVHNLQQILIKAYRRLSFHSFIHSFIHSLFLSFAYLHL